MEPLSAAFSSLLEVNMGVRNGERIVVFSDNVRPDEQVASGDLDRRRRLLETARNLADFARSRYGNVSFVSFPATAASGAEPPEELWRNTFGDSIVDSLLRSGLLRPLLTKSATDEELQRAREVVLQQSDAVADVVIALSNNSTSHTRFRALANAAGTRFASLPHFDPDMFFGSMQVDWNLLAERTNQLAAEVNQAVEILLNAPNGTCMKFDKRTRTAKADTGLLTATGSFGNLPAGEVYLAPVEGKSSGTMVIEYSPTGKLSAPLTLTVTGGRVTDLQGSDDYRRKLEAKFAEADDNRNIAELGIGTNDKATRPDNILEAEKILGTVHIALGDNSGFGGNVQTPFHEDYVIYQPTLIAVMPDGGTRTLLDKGRAVY